MSSSSMEYSDMVFRRQDVSIIAYKDNESPKPNIIVDYEGCEVTVYTSPTDGTLCIQIEPVNKKQLDNLRVAIEETTLHKGKVSNAGNSTKPNEFTVLFNDGQAQ